MPLFHAASFGSKEQDLFPTKNTSLDKELLLPSVVTFCCYQMLCKLIQILPKGGMYWEIHPTRTKIFPEGGDFVCTPRRLPKEVCVIFALGFVSRNVVPGAIFVNTLPREQGVYWPI